MNYFIYPGLLFRLAYRLALRTRWIAKRPVCKSFGRTTDQTPYSIEGIYVINLDRQSHRWKQIQKELSNIYDRYGTPLISLTERFAAIDAQDYPEPLNESVIDPQYSLSDQLFVEPQPLVSIGQINIDQRIKMTRQEVAVALSHIEVWKRVVSGEYTYSLVLEDDICFHRNFSRF